MRVSDTATSDTATSDTGTSDTASGGQADRGARSPASAPPTRSTQSRWVVPAALVFAVTAAIVATWALVHSPVEAPVRLGVPAVDSQQSDAARGRVCGAFDIVRKAVTIQTNADFGSDPVAREAVAANARLATLGGGGYLLSRMDPATPADLADSIRTFANDVQDIGMYQLVGTPNADPKMAALLASAQEAGAHIAQVCGR